MVDVSEPELMRMDLAIAQKVLAILETELSSKIPLFLVFECESGLE